MLVQPPLTVGIVGSVGHHAQVQGGGTKPADIGKAVHQRAEGSRLLGADFGLVAEPCGQDLPGTARYRSIEPGDCAAFLKPRTLAAGSVVHPAQGGGVDDARQPGAAGIGDSHRGGVVDDVADEVGGAVQGVDGPAVTGGVGGAGGSLFLAGDAVAGAGGGDDAAHGVFRGQVEGGDPVPGRSLVACVQGAAVTAGQDLCACRGGLFGHLQQFRCGRHAFSSTVLSCTVSSPAEAGAVASSLPSSSPP